MSRTCTVGCHHRCGMVPRLAQWQPGEGPNKDLPTRCVDRERAVAELKHRRRDSFTQARADRPPSGRWNLRSNGRTPLVCVIHRRARGGARSARRWRGQRLRPTNERREAYQDPRGGPSVTEDLQRHLEAFQVADGQLDGPRTASASPLQGQRDFNETSTTGDLGARFGQESSSLQGRALGTRPKPQFTDG
jgi:hypothetical protein